MKPEAKRYTTNVGTRTVTFETGKLAARAGGAGTVGINEDSIFAAGTMGGGREGSDFFRAHTRDALRPAEGPRPGPHAGRPDQYGNLFIRPAAPPGRCARFSNTGCATKSR